MTSVEIPLSIAAALPSLTVLDITNDVQREVATTGGSGIAFVSPNGDPSLIRVQERETGFFSDLEEVTVAREDVHFRLPREVAAQ